jgi:Fe2+ or Zn2+ uptake regulation protein
VTAPPNVPPLIVGSPDEAISALRASGLRLSTARRLMIEALFEADGPVAAAHLARALRLDESSVYRNLEVLEGHGLVRHLHLGHGPGLYVLAGRDDAEYLYCERCARVTAVAAEAVEPVRDAIRAQFGYAARFTHFAIVGLCEDCAGQAASSAAGVHDHPHSHGDFVHAHPHRGGAHTH